MRHAEVCGQARRGFGRGLLRDYGAAPSFVAALVYVTMASFCVVCLLRGCVVGPGLLDTGRPRCEPLIQVPLSRSPYVEGVVGFTLWAQIRLATGLL